MHLLFKSDGRIVLQSPNCVFFIYFFVASEGRLAAISVFGLCIRLRNRKSTWIQGHYNQVNDFGRLLQEEFNDLKWRQSWSPLGPSYCRVLILHVMFFLQIRLWSCGSLLVMKPTMGFLLSPWLATDTLLVMLSSPRTVSSLCHRPGTRLCVSGI